MSIQSHIESKLKLLPELPGCYLMKDSLNNIIYVGKAKNLKNRVRSYFKQAHDGKTQLLVNEIVNFETIVTNTNKEALLLEISLIQKYQPKYNIKLKSGSMYPYLKITNEENPRLMITNQLLKDGGHYFGPYPDVGAANETLQLLQKSFPLRRCSKNEKRACFYYHIGQCIGCCDHPITKAEYQNTINHITAFLNGDVSTIKKTLHEKMMVASENLDFEKAIDYREQIKYVEMTVEKQNILSQEFTHHDVFGYFEKNGIVSIQVFFLRQSSLIKREAMIFPIFNSVEDEVLSFIAQFYSDNQHLLPSEILIPETLDKLLLDSTLNTKITVPTRGKKKSILELAIKNSEIALNEYNRLETPNDKLQFLPHQELANLLNIPSANYIEAIDHSNTQGTNPVSALVVYENGKPNRQLYRKYKIKTVIGANEFQTTQEIIRRRYSRLLREGKPLPDLILMDGGPIQVQAATDILQDEFGLNIPVAGMVKNEKHQTSHLVFGNPLNDITIEKNSPVFRFITRIQDEVHRFAITFHRQLRSKQSLSSQLDNIQGVGEKTRKKILINFQNVSELATTDIKALKQIGISSAIAQKIIDHFNTRH